MNYMGMPWGMWTLFAGSFQAQLTDVLGYNCLLYTSYLAGSYRDKALMDNDYAADVYVRDMELEHIYAEAEKRLK